MARTSPSERRPGAGGVRLFLALDLPEDARAGIAAWRDVALGDRAELRPVAAEALHVTLVFLGRRSQGDVAEIWKVAACAAADRTVPSLTAQRLVPLPSRRPRLVALELEDADLKATALQEALSSALADAGLHEAEGRPFWPHVTLARVRGRSLLGKLERPAAPPSTAFPARTLTLYRSDLHPSGARYVPLERLGLAD